MSHIWPDAEDPAAEQPPGQDDRPRVDHVPPLAADGPYPRPPADLAPPAEPGAADAQTRTLGDLRGAFGPPSGPGGTPYAAPPPPPPAPEPGRPPFGGGDAFAAQTPLPGQQPVAPEPFAAQPPLPGQEPGRPPYGGPDAFPAQQPGAAEPFAAQDPLPGQPPGPAYEPFPGPAASAGAPPAVEPPAGRPYDGAFDQPPPAAPGYGPQGHPAYDAAPGRPGGRHSAGPPAFAPPAPPGRPPRPEDLLVGNEPAGAGLPASWGWRGRVNRGSGGLIKPRPSAQESAVRDAINRIQRGFSRPMTVVVIQPKGGAGKTPTTICLSAAFGAHRGGYVVGWDDNETRGTLAVRVLNPSSQTATVWDLLSDLPSFERLDARVGDLSHYVRAQPDAHFDALVSDDNPGNMSQIGENEFHRLHQVLQRFYRMIVVDTGNNVRSPNWQAAVNAADLVVVVSSYQRDVGYSGSWVLDHLAQTGREELARNAVTVLTAADPTTDKTVRGQLVEHFTNRTRAVAEIPYDAALAHGGPIKWTDLAPATRNAWILAGATVVDALVEQDARAQAARRAVN